MLAEVDGAYLRTGTATVKLRLPLARTTYDVVLYAVRSHEPPIYFRNNAQDGGFNYIATWP